MIGREQKIRNPYRFLVVYSSSSDDDDTETSVSASDKFMPPPPLPTETAADDINHISGMLKTSTPGRNLSPKAHCHSSSQLDVSVIPRVSALRTLRSSSEGQSTSQNSSSKESEYVPPSSSCYKQRKLTFDGYSNSDIEGVVEPTEDGIQFTTRESPLETSNTGILSFSEDENTDEHIVPVTTERKKRKLECSLCPRRFNTRLVSLIIVK